MIRVVLWSLAGLALGLVVHLVIILSLPLFAINNVWTNIIELDAFGRVIVLDQPAPGEPNPLGLDPELSYAICQFDLSEGPGVFSGKLPADFWSVGIFDRDGIAVYSTTNRSGVGQSLELGLFNAAQTRLLAEQQFEIEEGLLIVEAPQDEVFVVIRLAPPHPAMRGRYKQALSELDCGHIDDPDAISDI